MATVTTASAITPAANLERKVDFMENLVLCCASTS
jgi:hypothetical protein